MAQLHSTDWRQLPAAARPVAAATTDVVNAAQAHDGAALAGAAAELRGLDQAHTGLILGTAVRLLVEAAQPDGVTGVEVRSLLERCVRNSAPWLPDVDPQIVFCCWRARSACTPTTMPPRRHPSCWPDTLPC